MKDPQEKQTGPFKDGYDVFAAILVLGVVVWLVQNGTYESFRLWIKSLLVG